MKHRLDYIINSGIHQNFPKIESMERLQWGVHIFDLFNKPLDDGGGLSCVLGVYQGVRWPVFSAPMPCIMRLILLNHVGDAIRPPTAPTPRLPGGVPRPSTSGWSGKFGELSGW